MYILSRFSAIFPAAACLLVSILAFPAAAQTVLTLSTQYNAPQFVAVDANKTVFVTDTTHSLSALGLENGSYATTPVGYDTNFATLYTSPNGVAVGPGGHIYSVSMSSSVPGFFFLFEFGPPDYHEIVDGSLPVNGGVVNGVATDSQGNFFVADTNGTVIKIFAPDYASATSFSVGQAGTDHPFGIAFDSHDNIFVTDQLSGSGKVLEYATAGGITLLKTITSGNLQQPTGVAVDSHGNLYVADSAANTLTEFAAPDYTNAQVILSTGLSGPTGVAVDADDNIFVVDTGHNALKEILALPVVTALSTTAGPLTGGNTVTITGAHLTGATAVSFGGTAATSFTVVSDTQVTATAPAGSGTVDVRVTTPNGTSIAATADNYTYTAAPAVSSLSPMSGTVAGGNIVTITGSSFAGASAVSFGATPAVSFSVLGNTLISAVAPAGGAGTVDVTVTGPGGASTTSAADSYTYIAVPTVTAVSPGQGGTAGGTGVTITGANFSGATAVSFGGTRAASFAVNSANSITATSPSGAAGAVDVTVTTVGGTSATSSADVFTFVGAPAVSAVSPSRGPVTGGTAVTITGTNLAAVTGVSFGATAATFAIDSAIQITATAPAGSIGLVDITVTSAGGTSATGASDHFTYTVAPTVTAVTPSKGSTAGGTGVSITGTNFSGATAVTFGGTAATSFTVNSATSITATSPSGSAGAVDVTVVTPNGSSATSSVAVFTYVAPPAVTSVSPAGGPTAGDNSVTISGSNFSNANAVSFGGTAGAFTIDSATSITAKAPAGSAGTVDITVSVSGLTSATSAADHYSYADAPTITAISPNKGPIAGGTVVSITGTNLTGATNVLFGATAASSFSVTSATTASATAPAHGVGAVDVTIVTPGGTSATGTSDQFTYSDVPTITAINPNQGTAKGGTLVSIVGTNLLGVTGVKFGATAASSFSAASDTMASATAPPHAVGAVDVTWTTPGGTSATGAGDLFTYTKAPVLTTIARFANSKTDGAVPVGGLAADANGVLYGATKEGGANGLGTVFSLTRTGATTFSKKILHSFNGLDGATPYDGVALDGAGNLYLTTSLGGARNKGAIVALKPPGYAATVLYSFTGGLSDGGVPYGSLVRDSQGNLFGTTTRGGARGFGTVFKLASGASTVTVLHAFAGQRDARETIGTLVADSNGNLYGTGVAGGAYNVGSLFEVTSAGAVTRLHSFAPATTDGRTPYAGLFMNSTNQLYGATYLGGTQRMGAIFKLTPPSASDLPLLFSFTGTSGANPYGALTGDSANILYGTTLNGGANDKGTVFKLIPPANGLSGWSESVMYSFKGAGDGSLPRGKLLLGANNTLFGTTSGGGSTICTGGCGTVFMVQY